MKKVYLALFISVIAFVPAGSSYAGKSSAFRIARLHYGGGGDWYNGPMEEPTLLQFVRKHTDINVDPNFYPVNISNDNIFTYPFIFMTGHGNIRFTDQQAERLRQYLEDGGFLYADDDYGMDGPFRREIKKVLPNKPLVELPFSYGLYHCVYNFPNGVPKTQDWGDSKPPEGYGIFIGKRLAVYYTAESNPSDGWDPPSVHGDPEATRLEALKFGTNLIYWALTH
ncbi:MAG: DUF4159 domain-containing protein [Bacteroidetes bacterium]|nr:DUF4159 domain-containing protein [Bacteroidota bacterium]MCL5268651.1 DUF4159 domain-containing protein [Bacteroidota bacterium]